MTRFAGRALPRSLPILLALGAAACGREPPGGGTPLVTQLTPAGEDHSVASWAPDGRRVAYVARTPDGLELRIAGPDLAGSIPVARVGAFGGLPVWSADGRMLAYASAAAGSADVWVVAADGSGGRRLTTSEGIEVPIAWHPAGSRLAYIHTSTSGQIQCSVVELATGATAPLVEGMPEACGVWSPDGTRLAVMPLRAAGSTIWVADGDGRNPRQLTSEGFETLQDDFVSPWSPDGTEILYLSTRTGRSDLWVVPADSGAPRQLTRDLRNDFSGSWSPDGRHVAFVSDRGGQTDVWIAPIAGGPERRVTDDPAIETGPRWLGDSILTFTAARPTSSLWALDPASGAERRLTPDGERTGAPVPSPDGRELIYSVVRGGGVVDLHAIPAAGGEARPLVAGNGQNGWARWSPDGSTVVFASDRAGLGDIWTVPVVGGEPTRLTDTPALETAPNWSTDGKTIFYMTYGAEGSQLGKVHAVPAAGGESRAVTALGNAFAFWKHPLRDELFVGDYSGPAGRSRLVAVPAGGGTPRVVWDGSALLDLTYQAFSPAGDTVALQVDEGAAGNGTRLVPIAGGEARRISVGRNTIPGAWSPDGAGLVVIAAREGRVTTDLALVNLADGSSRWLTDSPERETGARWVLGGKELIFVRIDDHNWIARVEVPPTGR
jgi:Tol biopolymer transport system component